MITIEEAGELLYGPAWTAPLAHALGLTPRTAQRWAAGERQPTPQTWERIADLIIARQAQLARALRQIR